VRPSEGRVDSAELWCRKAELGPVSFAQNRDGCEGRVRACFFYSWCQQVQRSIAVQQQSNRTTKKKNPSCTANT
jgi:hypothetical protein